MTKSKAGAVQELAAAHNAAAIAQEELYQAVQAARAAGVEWQEIADTVGLKSKQAAQQRWAPRTRTRTPR